MKNEKRKKSKLLRKKNRYVKPKLTKFEKLEQTEALMPMF